MRFFQIDHGFIREISTDNNTEHLPLIEQADWIDVREPSDEERKLLSKSLGIELPNSGDVGEIEASSRYFVDNEGLHVHSLFISPTEGRHTTVNIAFILQENRLVTIREGSIADFRLLRLRARKGQVSCENVQSLFITILEQKIENHADTLEDIHFQLEKVSHTVLEDLEANLEECISRLAKLEDSNGKIRLCLMDTQRIISFLLRNLESTPEQLERLREIGRDIETLMSHATFLFEKINFLMDSTQGFINIEQNKIIKIFSIAAVVFLPPTVIGSIYGMNFAAMPELEWTYGYPFALSVMVASGFAPYLYFKRKGWLK